jgi:hypothetical protein
MEVAEELRLSVSTTGGRRRLVRRAARGLAAGGVRAKLRSDSVKRRACEQQNSCTVRVRLIMFKNRKLGSNRAISLGHIT